jgi:hypothetical protein
MMNNRNQQPTKQIPAIRRLYQKYNSYKSRRDSDLYYLKENRLSSVIAAITVMGLHEDYNQPARRWIYRSTGVKEIDQSERLQQQRRAFFKDHSEFFRESTTDRDEFSLILRRALEKDGGLRPPISEEIIKLLIDTATAIHGKQFSQRVDRRWLIVLLVPFIGSLAGALVGSVLGSK